MKRFLTYTSVFILIGVILLGAIGIYNYFQLKKTPVLKSEIVFIGDSRVMTGINPDLIKGSDNIAQNTESYLVSFYKLKKILPSNKNIRKVVLGFSYHSFSGYLDNLYKDDLATGDIMNRIYPIMKPADFNSISFDWTKYYKAVFKNVFLYPHSNHFSYIGKFEKLNYGLDKAKLAPVILRHYYTDDSANIGISGYAANYLDSIVSLTQKHQVELILLNIPLHKKYTEYIPQNFVTYYNSKKEEMQKRTISVLDYGHLNLPDKYFKDYNHLDLEGANFFTKKLITDLD